MERSVQLWSALLATSLSIVVFGLCLHGLVHSFGISFHRILFPIFKWYRVITYFCDSRARKKIHPRHCRFSGLVIDKILIGSWYFDNHGL